MSLEIPSACARLCRSVWASLHVHRGLRGEGPAASEDGMLRLGAHYLPTVGRAGGGGRERRLWPWTPPRGCCTHTLLTSAFCSFSLGGHKREPLRRTLGQGKNMNP